MAKKILTDVNTVEDFEKYDGIWKHPVLLKEIETEREFGLEGDTYRELVRAVSLSMSPVSITDLNAISKKNNWEGDCAKQIVKTRDLIFSNGGMLEIYLKGRSTRVRHQFKEGINGAHQIRLSDSRRYPSVFLLTKFYEEVVNELEFRIMTQGPNPSHTKSAPENLMGLFDKQVLVDHFQQWYLVQEEATDPYLVEYFLRDVDHFAFEVLHHGRSVRALEGGRADGNKTYKH